MNIKDANGTEGHLTYVHGKNEYVFRVYEGDGKFTDYAIMHCDLSVKILDADSAFYKNGSEAVLDHSPETLDIKRT